MKPRITFFEPYRRYGWCWGVEYDDIHTDARTEHTYHTNGEAEGLWHGGRQTLGTGQFALSQDRRRARAQVYYQFVRRTDDYGIRLS